MGVWQVTEDQQPYIGQWDAVTDSFWDGLMWVTPKKFLTPETAVSLGECFENEFERSLEKCRRDSNGLSIYSKSSVSGRSIPNTQGWTVTTSPRPVQESLAVDAWAALQSMY